MRLARIAAAILSVVLLPSVAWAHAAYKDSDPKDESIVASPPSSVWAEYTEPLQEGSYLEIYDPCGTRVDGDDTSITAYRMQVSMSSDKAGTYSVRWVAASAVDPHVTRGTFTFSVSEGATCDVAAGPEEDSTDDSSDTRRAVNDSSSDAAANDGSTTTRRNGRSGTDVQRRRAAAEKQTTASANESATDDEGFVAAQGTERAAGDGGIWDGIPLDGFALALAIAAAIGAAGGRIYANIMGPHR